MIPLTESDLDADPRDMMALYPQQSDYRTLDKYAQLRLGRWSRGRWGIASARPVRVYVFSFLIDCAPMCAW